MYPAKGSTGFPERNLTVNFSKAYEKTAGHYAEYPFSWFEFQFGEKSNQHIDAVIFNQEAKTMIVIESKRFNNPSAKVVAVEEDIDRTYDFVDEIVKKDGERIDLGMYSYIYGMILADVWTETDTKMEILKSFEEESFLKKYSDSSSDILLESRHQIQNPVYYPKGWHNKNYHLLGLLWQIH